MSRGGKIFVVLAIMICGIGTAALFRDTHSTNDPNSDERFSGLSFRGASPSASIGSNGENGASFEPTTPQQLDTVSSSSNLPREDVTADEPPSRRPGGRLVSRTPNPKPTQANGSFLDGANWPALDPDDVNTAEPIERDLRGHMHKIRDGDTLDELARRYLGNPRRAKEIFAANRHVLTNPQILPLGRSIRIPPRRVAIPRVDSPRENPLRAISNAVAPRSVPTASALTAAPAKKKDTPEKDAIDKEAFKKKTPTGIVAAPKSTMTEPVKREFYDPSKPIPLFGPDLRADSLRTKKVKPRVAPVAKKSAVPSASPTASVLPLAKPISVLAPKSISPNSATSADDQLLSLPKGALRQAREEAKKRAAKGSGN